MSHKYDTGDVLEERDEKEEDADQEDTGLPENGELVTDAEEDEMLLVVESVETRADEFVLYTTEGGQDVTLASYNRGKYPGEDRVVRAIYADQLLEIFDGDTGVTHQFVRVAKSLSLEAVEFRDPDERVKVYAFPESRIEWRGSE